MLVRFLASRTEQVRRSHYVNEAPTIAELYNDPQVLVANPQFPLVLEVFRKSAVFRPSIPAGKMYPEVSQAYFEAVHAVLSGKTSASEAASDLEAKLQQMLKTIASNETQRALAAAQQSRNKVTN